jgi:uncharacterized protein
MILRKHEGNRKLILALCDDSLLGKTFRSGSKVLDLASDFYDGEPVTETELTLLLKKAHVVNAAGKESTSFLVSKQALKDKDIMHIDGIPCAQVIIRW